MTPAGPTPPSLRRFVRGLGRCVARAPTLAVSLAPVGWPRTVERLALQAGLADERGASRTARRCRAWLALLGHADAECPTSPWPGGVPSGSRPALRRASRRRALAALADVSAEVDRSLDALSGPIEAVGGAVPREPLTAFAIAAPAALVRLPSAIASTVVRGVVRTAPPLPALARTTHVEGNLLTDLVAEALPGLLASAPVRHLVHRIRRPVSVGVRVGRVGTTVVVSRDGLRVRNGIGRHVTFVFEGGVEPLLRRAVGRVEQEAEDLENR